MRLGRSQTGMKIEIFKYYLKNEQECFIRFKARARSASGFRPNKTRPASFLNDFKNICIRSQSLYKNLYIKIFIGYIKIFI